MRQANGNKERKTMKALFVTLLTILMSSVVSFAQTFEVGYANYMEDNPIHVDRTAKPDYPPSLLNLDQQDLEATGPFDYSSKWIWMEERKHSEKGSTILAGLVQSGILRSCFSYQDGEAIKKLGVDAFRTMFGRQEVFLWKSVAVMKPNIRAVPYIFELNGEVSFNWRPLGNWFPPDVPVYYLKRPE